MQPQAKEPEIHDQDPIDMALAWHDGDARATIATLLEDCRELREQLALTTVAMGRGFTRGWVPKGTD